MLDVKQEATWMKKDVCILCGRVFPTGLNVMGCFICFPCEKELLGPSYPDTRRRNLMRLYAPARKNKKSAAFPFFREQNQALLR